MEESQDNSHNSVGNYPVKPLRPGRWEPTIHTWTYQQVYLFFVLLPVRLKPVRQRYVATRWNNLATDWAIMYNLVSSAKSLEIKWAPKWSLERLHFIRNDRFWELLSGVSLSESESLLRSKKFVLFNSYWKVFASKSILVFLRWTIVRIVQLLMRSYKGFCYINRYGHFSQEKISEVTPVSLCIDKGWR